MPKHAENIFTDALELPSMARAGLVENILSSFEFQGGDAINKRQRTEQARLSVVK